MARAKSPWVDVKEVMDAFGCRRAKAYEIIRRLNEELKERGFLTYAGRVSRRYFEERYYG